MSWTGRNKLSAYFEILIHIILWGLLLSAIYNGVESYWVDLYKSEFKGDWNAIQYMAWKKEHADPGSIIFPLTVIAFKALFFYINVYLIFPSFNRKKWISLILKVLLNLILCLIAEYAVFMAVESSGDLISFGLDNYFDSENLETLGIWFGYIFLLAILYALIRHYVLNRGKRLEKITAELALLKNQVNPHFLFNTLNNFYAMAVEKDATELADGIAQLTHLMRYTIYESNVAYIPLETEIAYVHDYIKLQSLRFTKEDKISIGFDDQHVNLNLPIAPMLLIGFVENAFKHGISLKADSFIHIRMHSIDNEIHFEIENSIHHGMGSADVKYAGFGLNHVRKLLNLQYPGKHKLEIREEKDIFKVVLTVITSTNEVYRN
ncbi:sensor histidine kinase [Pedobacter metabolipauper]|uniref:GHKL domain-containing protein n=1 Tax=Pedobacter metabolipauper TaxID=425513 RepID=A0A4R6SZ35_9SPHI|nr:sensor histidine kinase [Pedobacter metabolipauper]TDQ09785.1 GHKL domain-containing protein [Pedobacter metabolipauper]